MAAAFSPVPQGGRSRPPHIGDLKWRRLPRRGVRRNEGIPPYGRPVGCGCPVSRVIFGRFVGAGFTAPAGAFRRPTAAQRRLLGRRSRPGPCGDAGFPGRCKHRPLQRFVITQGRSFPVGRGIFPVPQGGRSRPPHIGGLKWRRSRRRRVRRDGGIPPYGRPEGGGRPCLAPNTKFIRRGGFHIRLGPCGDAGFPGRSPA